MDAEEFGRGLLSQVEVVSMDKVLSALRIAHGDDPEARLGIPQLEGLLRAELGATGHRVANAGSTNRSSPPPLERRAGHRRPVVELTSTSSGAGKTHLLYLLTSQAVLPPIKADARGAHKAIVVLDADNRFDVKRLATVLRQQIEIAHRAVSPQPDQTPPTYTEDDTAQRINEPRSDEQFVRGEISDTAVDELVESSLRHVHVFRPQSLAALVATVMELETYLLSPSSHFSGDRHVSTILLDSASTFYWQHRANEEAVRAHKAEGTLNAHAATEPPLYTRLLRALQHVQQTLDCAVIYTSLSNLALKETVSSASRSFESAGRLDSRPLLPASWSSYSALQLQLQRVKIAKFAVGMGAKEAWGDRDLRWEAVRTGQFTASTTDNRGSQRKVFDFVVDDDGVRIDDGGHSQPDPGRP